MKVLLFSLLLVLTACTSDNEHFCMRYQYIYDQLDQPDLPPFAELKMVLDKELKDPKKDHNHTRMMLFVLDEYRLGIKPEYEEAKAYCIRRQRWQAYSSS